MKLSLAYIDFLQCTYLLKNDYLIIDLHFN